MSWHPLLRSEQFQVSRYLPRTLPAARQYAPDSVRLADLTVLTVDNSKRDQDQIKDLRPARPALKVTR